VFVQLVPAILLAMLHPMLGLIFVIAISGQSLAASMPRAGAWAAVFAALCAALWYAGAVPLIDAVDSVVGVTLSALAFVWMLRTTLSWIFSLVGVTVLQTLYAFLRRMFFGAEYRAMIETAFNLLGQNLKQASAQVDPARREALEHMLQQGREILVQYQVAFWVVPVVLGCYLGALLLSRRLGNAWNHRASRLPYAMVWPLIAALGLFIAPGLRQTGLNLLVIFAWLFFLQGMMIIDFYWGRYFAHSRGLTAILVLAIMLNYFIMGLVIVMGLLDTWFNFRKLPEMEDVNADHSHPGDS